MCKSVKVTIVVSIVIVDVQREGVYTLRYDYFNAGYESKKNFILSLNIMHELKTVQVSPDLAFEF